MIEQSLKFGSDGRSFLVRCSEGFEHFAQSFVMNDVMRFANHIPELKPDEPFYFGFWRVVIKEFNGVLLLWEWDFDLEEFQPELGKSLRLWYEQAIVCGSQNLSWHSVRNDQLVYFTPSVWDFPIASTTEGFRTSKRREVDSGWTIYTEADRKVDAPFSYVPLVEVLRIYNINILRFLGLPPRWMFNIETNGRSHIWEEP